MSVGTRSCDAEERVGDEGGFRPATGLQVPCGMSGGVRLSRMMG